MVSPPATTSSDGATGKRILLVDDEAEFLRITRKILELNGFQVLPFQDGREALRFFQNAPHGVDAVITDQTMPILDGVELFLRIREVNRHIPVIICSGNCRTVPLDTVCNLGLDACLQKPVAVSLLIQTLQQVLYPDG